MLVNDVSFEIKCKKGGDMRGLSLRPRLCVNSSWPLFQSNVLRTPLPIHWAHKSAQISVTSENFCGTTSWQAPCAHVEVGAEAGQHEMRQHEMSVSSFFSGLEERENQFGGFLSFPVMTYNPPL